MSKRFNVLEHDKTIIIIWLRCQPQPMCVWVIASRLTSCSTCSTTYGAKDRSGVTRTFDMMCGVFVRECMYVYVCALCMCVFSVHACVCLSVVCAVRREVPQLPGNRPSPSTEQHTKWEAYTSKSTHRIRRTPHAVRTLLLTSSAFCRDYHQKSKCVSAEHVSWNWKGISTPSLPFPSFPPPFLFHIVFFFLDIPFLPLLLFCFFFHFCCSVSPSGVAAFYPFLFVFLLPSRYFLASSFSVLSHACSSILRRCKPFHAICRLTYTRKSHTFLYEPAETKKLE